MRQMLRRALGLVLAGYAVLGAAAVILAVLLTVHAETVRGRLCGLAALVFVPVPVFLYLCLWPRVIRLCRLAAVCLAAAALVLFAICYRLAPTGMPPAGSCARSVFTGETRFHRVSIANLVPEIDQLKIATYVLPLIEGSQRTRTVFLGVYRNMLGSREFEDLGSVLGYTYLDLFMNQRPVGHFYEYVSSSANTTNRIPVILFVHGSFGGFRGYLWIWKQFADQNGYAIVAPTFGFGNWDLPGGVESIESARQYCLRHARMDGRRIILAGLSNGGRGALRAAAEHPDAYQGLILMSPVMDDAVIDSKAFAQAWERKPVLVLEGAGMAVSARATSETARSTWRPPG